MKPVLVIFSVAVGLGLSATRLRADGLDPVMVPVHINATAVLTPEDESSSFSLSMDTADADGTVIGLTGTGGKTIAALVVNQVYYITISTADIMTATFSVVPPPGYTAEIDGVIRPTAPAVDNATHAIRILPNTQSGAADSGVASSFMGDHPYWQVSLGRLQDGISAGWLNIGASYGSKNLSPLFTPAALQYISTSAEVVVIYSGGNIRQIITDDVCVDVETLSSTKYELNFIPACDIVSGSGYPVSFTSGYYPFISYVISEGTAGTNEICIKSTTYSAPTTVVRTAVTTLTASGSSYPFTWTTQDWHTGSTAPVQIVVTNAGSTNSSSPETIQVEDSSGTVATTETRLLSAFSWGDTGGYALTSSTLGSSNSIPETDQYYTDGSATESCGFPMASSANGNWVGSSSENGHWVGYEYQSNSNADGNDGVISKIHRQYLNSTTTVPSSLSGDTNGSVTSYTYTINAFNVYARPLTIQTVYGGTTIAYSTISYHGVTDVLIALNGMSEVIASHTDWANSTGSSTLSSTICTYREDISDEFYANKTCSITRSDGTEDEYAYQRGSYSAPTFTTSGLGTGSCSRIMVIHGTTQSTDPQTGSSNSEVTGTSDGYSFVPTSGTGVPNFYVVANKSTRDITIRDQYAHIVHTETDVWDGSAWQKVQCVDYAYDSLNHHMVTETTHGATVTYVYNGEQLSTETDAAGVVTTYGYDAAGRVACVKKSASSSSLSTTSLTTTITYDGASHVTGQTVGGAITSSAAYDDAGRVTSTTDPNSGTTSYSYSPSTYTTTVTLPNGGTRIDVTDPDAHLAQETGTGVVARYFTYTTSSSDGSLTTKVNYNSSGSPRYESVQTDVLGRTMATARPTSNSGATYAVQNTYDSTTGLLAKTSRTDGTYSLANIFYLYDAMAQCYRQGMDVDNSGTLETNSSTDQITDTIQNIQSYDSAWWKTMTTIAYPTPGSGTGFTTSVVRQRLTGLSSTLAADQLVTDSYGTTTETQATLSSSANTVTATTTNPGFSSSSAVVSVAGLPISETGFDGLTTSIGYDSLWRPITRKDSRSNTITIFYETGNNLVDYTTDATSATLASYTYDSAGRPTVTTTGGNSTRVAYNYFNEVTEQWGDSPCPVEYGYDSYGQRTTMKTFQNGGSWSSSSWPGEPSSTNETTWAYDEASGLVTSKTDAASHSVGFTYDNFGRTLTRTWARGVTTTYTYDTPTGNLTEVSYSDSTPVVQYSYTRSGQLSTVKDATTAGDSGTRTFAYDSSINTNPLELEAEHLDSGFYGTSNQWLSQLYNTSNSSSSGAYASYTAGSLLGRPAGFQLGASENHSDDLYQYYTHSNQGQMVGVQTQNGSGYIRYFIYNYLTSSSLVSGSWDNISSFSTTRNYETQRNLLTSIKGTWSSTPITEFDYVNNSLYQASSVVQSGTAFAGYGGTNGSTFQLFTYDSRGELTNATGYLGSDITNTGSPLPDRNFCYGYDPTGNRTFSNYTGSDSLKETYTPDNLNQYTARDNFTVPVSGYIENDATANVAIGTSSSGASSSTVLAGRQGGFWAGEALPPLTTGGTPVPINSSGPATFLLTLTAGDAAGAGDSAANDQYSMTKTLTIAPQSQSFTYDYDGNMTADNMWTYTYDAENRLTVMETSSAAQSAGITHVRLTFTYDFLGRRVEKLVYNVATSTILRDDRYIYDGWNLIADLKYNPSLSTYQLYRTFTWGLDLTGSLTAAGGVGALLEITNFTYCGSTLTGTTDFFPTYDGNGNVASLVDSGSGDVAAAYEYSPFGETLQAQANNSLVADNPFRFSTKFTDVDSAGNNKMGLIYYGNRFYSPSLGRFINRDPIEEAGGINLYGFVNNDPANGFDVLGYEVDSDPGRGLTANPIISPTDPWPDQQSAASVPIDPSTLSTQSGEYWQYMQQLEIGTAEAADWTQAILNGVATGQIQGTPDSQTDPYQPVITLADGSQVPLSQWNGPEIGTPVAGAIGGIISAGLDAIGNAVSGLGNDVESLVSGGSAPSGEYADGVERLPTYVVTASSLAPNSTTSSPNSINYLTTVTLNFKNIPGGDALGIKNPNLYPQHSFVTITNNQTGEVWIARAGPGGPGGNWLFGSISATVVPDVPGSTLDYGATINASQVVLNTNENPATLVAELNQFATAVNQAQIGYNPLTQNSNSFAFQAVQLLTGSRPQSPVWAPASQTTLNVGP